MDRKNQQRGPAKYNTRMISDFLEHLMWEVRILHAESTHLQQKINPELVKQLTPFMRKYHCGLLVGNVITPDPQGEIDVEDVVRRQWARRAKQAQEWIDALETLRPLFDEALACAKRGGASARSRTAREVAEELDSEERNGGA